MRVCVGRGFHSRFIESLFNWFADFHLSRKTTYMCIKEQSCAVTVIHIRLYPAFSLFLEETRKEHLDQVRAAAAAAAVAALSYATALNSVFLLCCGTDVLFH